MLSDTLYKWTWNLIEARPIRVKKPANEIFEFDIPPFHFPPDHGDQMRVQYDSSKQNMIYENERKN